VKQQALGEVSSSSSADQHRATGPAQKNLCICREIQGTNVWTRA
jgi:hypothetical protein